jgi:hypothetical protein
MIKGRNKYNIIEKEMILRDEKWKKAHEKAHKTGFRLIVQIVNAPRVTGRKGKYFRYLGLYEEVLSIVFLPHFLTEITRKAIKRIKCGK